MDWLWAIILVLGAVALGLLVMPSRWRGRASGSDGGGGDFAATDPDSGHGWFGGGHGHSGDHSGGDAGGGDSGGGDSGGGGDGGGDGGGGGGD
jgi:hypothetical protein